MNLARQYSVIPMPYHNIIMLCMTAAVQNNVVTQCIGMKLIQSLKEDDMSHIVSMPYRKTIWLISPYSYLGNKENQEICVNKMCMCCSKVTYFPFCLR